MGIVSDHSRSQSIGSGHRREVQEGAEPLNLAVRLPYPVFIERCCSGKGLESAVLFGQLA